MSRPLRVVLAIMYPLDPSRRSGGLQAVGCDLVRGFKTVDDLELHVVHCTKEVDSDLVVQDGPVFVHYLHVPRRRVVPNMLTSVWKLRREFRRIQPDVVNAHMGHYATAGILARAPTVFTVHSISWREAKAFRKWFDRLRYRVEMLYDRFAVQRVRRVVAINPYVREQYRAEHDPRWTEIPIPVSDDYFAVPDRTVPGRILCAGTITELKNGLALLQALRLVREWVPDAHVHFVGRIDDPQYLRRMEAYAAENGLAEAVVFHGLVRYEKMLQTYSECAVLALTSREESSPRVILEAAAAGKPSVSVLVGSVGDMIEDGVSGYVEPQDNTPDLADRLVRVLTDDDLRRRLGAAAKQRVEERYSLHRVVAQYMDLYRDVARGG
ncbi:MAG: glycosyltransferase family 4 protein [Anaerolineae bacterium]|nr:glycosyltransferase family 4 protein [Anaerolineae bacterium]